MAKQQKNSELESTEINTDNKAVTVSKNGNGLKQRLKEPLLQLPKPLALRPLF